jgi:hypothetical protein
VNEAPIWLWEELLHFSASAALVHGGYLQWDVQRAMEVSFLLNNLFVRIVAEQRGVVASRLAASGDRGEVSLASLRGTVRDIGDGALREWGCAEVKAVGLMRVALAHPKDRKTRIADAMRELKSHEGTFAADVRLAVMKVAGMLDRLADSSDAISRFVMFYTGR